MANRPKFRIGVSAECWQVLRGHWAPKQRGYAWRVESHHASLPDALRFMHDRLIREGYEPKGLEALAASIEESYDRVAAYARELLADPSAKLEV